MIILIRSLSTGKILKRELRAGNLCIIRQIRFMIKKPVGKDVYFISGYNAPNFRLCKTNLENPDFKTRKF